MAIFSAVTILTTIAAFGLLYEYGPAYLKERLGQRLIASARRDRRRRVMRDEALTSGTKLLLEACE